MQYVDPKHHKILQQKHNTTQKSKNEHKKHQYEPNSARLERLSPTRSSKLSELQIWKLRRSPSENATKMASSSLLRYCNSASSGSKNSDSYGKHRSERRRRLLILGRRRLSFWRVHEGRNHEVRELVKNAGLQIHALKRLRIGGLRLPSDLGYGFASTFNIREDDSK
ncbi:hypothetical protein OROMI_010430 [Orobanche minor]